MSHDISELDIPDRLLLPAHTRGRASTEIGEAVVTHSIFGRAKVRIIRKGDRMRRAVWLMALAVAAAAAMAAWHGWMASQQPELPPSVEPESSLDANAQQSVPVAQPEYAAQPAVVPPQESKPLTLPQGEQNIAPAGQKSAPSQAQAAKPVAVAPPVTRKLQTPPPENEISAAAPADTQPPPKPAHAKPAVTPPVAMPRASQPAAQAAPSDKEEAPAQAPAGDRHAADPVSAQP